MREAGGGSIINMASVSSFIAQPAFIPYNASKGAILQMTRCLAMDLAPDKIRVNAVCPGAIKTEATKKHIESLGLVEEQAYIDFGQDALMKRMGLPMEVAYGVLFLASDEASFITGEHLVIDGGATIY
jgi:NAD(P)-dependent dehydrogenase (short-subunit alcohol dehydrogenase family)